MKLIYVLSIAFVLGATPALADPPVELKVLPKCNLHWIHGGMQGCVYTLAQWKLVLKADAELFSKRILLDKEKERSAILEEQKIDLHKQVKLYTTNQDLLLVRNNKLTQDLIDLDKKYQNERVKPRWGSPIAWTVAAVSTGLLVGLLVEKSLD